MNVLAAYSWARTGLVALIVGFSSNLTFDKGVDIDIGQQNFTGQGNRAYRGHVVRDQYANIAASNSVGFVNVSSLRQSWA